MAGRQWVRGTGWVLVAIALGRAADLAYPNPMRERGAIQQVPHSRFGL
jgi:hypothetical protein